MDKALFCNMVWQGYGEMGLSSPVSGSVNCYMHFEECSVQFSLVAQSYPTLWRVLGLLFSKIKVAYTLWPSNFIYIS